MPTIARALVVVSIAVGAIAACGGTTASRIDATDASTRVCLPGQSVACVGAGGCAGVRACNVDGSAFESCVCASGVDASLLDSSLPDGSLSDAWSRDATPHDAARVDGCTSGTGTSDGGVCMPGSVAMFQPTYHAPNAVRSDCTAAQITAHYTACFDIGHTPATCSAWKNASSSNAACAACILTDACEVTYGAVVFGSGVYSANVAGCLQLLDPVGGASCARAMQAANQCDDAACAPSCPITDDPSFQLYIACIQQASSNGCQTYSQAATACEIAEADGGAAAPCFQGQDFQGFYNIIAPMFCSGGG